MGQIWSSLCIFLILFHTVKADIVVWEQIPPNSSVPQTQIIVDNFDDIPDRTLSRDSFLTGLVLSTDPADGCFPIRPPPPLPPRHSSSLWIAIIHHGGCSNDVKASNAENAGYKAVILPDDKNEDLIWMTGGLVGDNISIPVVYIGKDGGITILQSYLYTTNSDITVYVDGKYSLFQYISPIVFGIGKIAGCILLLGLGRLLCECCMELAKLALDRCLSRNRDEAIVETIAEEGGVRRVETRTRKLKISRRKFSSSDSDVSHEVCTICFERFEEEEELWILQCDHAYHSKCIEPWLNLKKECPLCKRIVAPTSENASLVETLDLRASQQNPDPQASGENLHSVQSETVPLMSGGDEDEFHGGACFIDQIHRLFNIQSRGLDVDEPQPQTSSYGAVNQIPPELESMLPQPPVQSLHQSASQSDTHSEPNIGILVEI